MQPSAPRPADTKVGFIGLGIMGGPMAGHVLSAGYELHVHNRTQAKAEHLEDVLDIIQHVTSNAEENAEETAVKEIVTRHQPPAPTPAHSE